MEFSPLDNDVSILLKYCKVYAFIGFAPTDINKKPKRKIKLYVLFVVRFCLLVVLSGWGLYFRISKGGLFQSKVANTTGCLQAAGEFAFVASTYIVAVIRADKWDRFFEELNGFRILMNRSGRKYNCTKSSTCHVLKISCFLALFIFFNAWDLYEGISLNIIVALSFRFFMLSQLLPTVLVSRIMVVVKHRYTVLIKLLHASSRTTVEDEKTIDENIKLLKGLLKKCYFMVEALNDIFGWPIFLMSVTTSFTLLSGFLWLFERKTFIVYDSPISFAGDDYIRMIFFVIVYLAFTIMIVIYCDATEKEGARFTDLCYTIYVKETNKYLKREFKSLAVVSEKIGPNFSAAGFFTINQMFLSSFFSALTSYAIVCIQFSTL